MDRLPTVKLRKPQSIAHVHGFQSHHYFRKYGVRGLVTMLAEKGWEGVIWEGELKELTSEEIRNPKQG